MGRAPGAHLDFQAPADPRTSSGQKAHLSGQGSEVALTEEAHLCQGTWTMSLQHAELPEGVSRELWKGREASLGTGRWSSPGNLHTGQEAKRQGHLCRTSMNDDTIFGFTALVRFTLHTCVCYTTPTHIALRLELLVSLHAFK